MPWIPTVGRKLILAPRYFGSIERALVEVDNLHQRFIGVASVAYGKAMTILGGNVEIRDEFAERAHAIADRFYEQAQKTGNSHAIKVVEYCARNKHEHERWA